MADTTVGLFEAKTSADAVILALKEAGIPASELRLIVEPEWMPAISTTSVPQTDFEATLLHDLYAVGVPADLAKSYTDALRHGHVLVLATGTSAQALEAAEIMNEYGAIETSEGESFGSAGSLATNGLLGLNGYAASEKPLREDSSPTSFLTHDAGTNDAGTHETVPTTVGARVAQERKRSEGAQVFSW
jgi:hypothetical protein